MKSAGCGFIVAHARAASRMPQWFCMVNPLVRQARWYLCRGAEDSGGSVALAATPTLIVAYHRRLLRSVLSDQAVRALMRSSPFTPPVARPVPQWRTKVRFAKTVTRWVALAAVRLDGLLARRPMATRSELHRYTGQADLFWRGRSRQSAYPRAEALRCAPYRPRPGVPS